MVIEEMYAHNWGVAVQDRPTFVTCDPGRGIVEMQQHPRCAVSCCTPLASNEELIWETPNKAAIKPVREGDNQLREQAY